MTSVGLIVSGPVGSIVSGPVGSIVSGPVGSIVSSPIGVGSGVGTGINGEGAGVFGP